MGNRPWPWPGRNRQLLFLCLVMVVLQLTLSRMIFWRHKSQSYLYASCIWILHRSQDARLSATRKIEYFFLKLPTNFDNDKEKLFSFLLSEQNLHATSADENRALTGSRDPARRMQKFLIVKTSVDNPCFAEKKINFRYSFHAEGDGQDEAAAIEMLLATGIWWCVESIFNKTLWGGVVAFVCYDEPRPGSWEQDEVLCKNIYVQFPSPFYLFVYIVYVYQTRELLAAHATVVYISSSGSPHRNNILNCENASHYVFDPITQVYVDRYGTGFVPQYTPTIALGASIHVEILPRKNNYKYASSMFFN